REHLAGVLGGLGRRGGQVGADQHGHQLAPLLLGQLAPGGQRRQRRRAQPLVIGFAEDDDGAHQITFASLWSLATSSSTDATLTPALRPAGASNVLTVMAGLASTPSSARATSLISFFLAAMIPLRDAYRWVSSHSASAAASPSLRTAFLPMMRRSTVTTAGSRTRFSSTPASTSRVTTALLPSVDNLMLARNVACGQPSRPARICPTWFESPSTVCLPSTTRSGFSLATTAASTRAVASASSAPSSPPISKARSAPMAKTPRSCCPTS